MVLNGGLGNQLFQLSRATFLNPDGVLYLNQSIGKNRKIKNNVDLFSFTLATNVIKDSKDKSNIFSKLANRYLLHRVVSSRETFYAKILEKLSFIVIKISQSNLRFREWKLLLGKGSGYNESLVSSESNYVLVGYFQSWRWFDPEINAKILRQIQPTVKSEIFLALEKVTKTKKILMIHIRIGDYKADDDFGVLTKSYYEKSINLITSKYPQDEIWVFSDSIAEAKKMVAPFLKGVNSRFVSDDLSTAESFELLRNGSAFIIANSTFSWWGAQLSYSSNPTVVAPKKWFHAMPDPKDICPPAWIRI